MSVGQHWGPKPDFGVIPACRVKLVSIAYVQEECCLNAVKVEDNSRRIHWLEAAARWVALGRQEGALLTTSDLATVAKRHDAVKSSLPSLPRGRPRLG